MARSAGSIISRSAKLYAEAEKAKQLKLKLSLPEAITPDSPGFHQIPQEGVRLKSARWPRWQLPSLADPFSNENPAFCKAKVGSVERSHAQKRASSMAERRSRASDDPKYVKNILLDINPCLKDKIVKNATCQADGALHAEGLDGKEY